MKTLVLIHWIANKCICTYLLIILLSVSSWFWMKVMMQRKTVTVSYKINNF